MPTDAALSLAAGLAAQLLDAPIALIELFDPAGESRHFSYGLPGDASLPANPDVRVVASIPLRAESRLLGTLSIMDTAERRLTPHQAVMLRRIAAVVCDAALKASDAFPPRDLIDTKETPPDSSLRLTLSGRITAADPRFEDRLGYAPGSLAGRNLSDILPASDRTAAMQGFLAQIGAGGSLTNTLRLSTANGSETLFRVQTRLVFENGMPYAIDTVARDISSESVRLEALQDAEHALLAKAEQMARFSEHLRQLHRLATAEYSAIDDLLDDYLATGSEILRLPRGLVVSIEGGRPAVRAASSTAETTRDWLSGAAIESLINRGTCAYPHDFDPSDPAPLPGYPCWIGAPMYAGDDPYGVLLFCSAHPGDVRRFSAHEREILELMAKSLGRSVFEEQLRRERARLTLELARQTQQDPLTGLWNRLSFIHNLETQLQHAADSNGTLAVALVDLDRFKQINDTLGHAVGDEMLRHVASRIAADVSPDDHVARVGGDEFTIVFGGNPTRASISATAQRLLESLRAPYTVHDSELFVTATVGISFFPEDARDAKDLLQKADAAMYRAKAQGKDEFRFFTPDILVRSSNRLELETQLRRALEKGELRLAFQPLVNIDRTLDSLEALLAWNNPRFGRVGAARFIPIAEESGMIIPIGAWVLREVCRQVAEWQSRGIPALRVAINVSMLQFARPDFVETVARALSDTGMPPQCLELELTESMIMRDVEASARRMTELREVGVSIAIDDFGTGYSSLSYLRRLPVDTLKIDRSFIAELRSSSASLPLIETVVALAHNMGLAVVAEGVETREQFKLLRNVGCDKVQGHLFGEPLTLEAAEELLRRPDRDVPIVSKAT